MLVPMTTDARPGRDEHAAFQPEALLKQDLFGRVERGSFHGRPAVRRDPGGAPLVLRPLARWLARRERLVLEALGRARIDGMPTLLAAARGVHLRAWIDGVPMHHAAPADPDYYRRARRLLGRLHRAGIVHNDLAKEANWLVREDGTPGIVDFQLAWASRRPRARLVRLLAREDLRHLLKHKRHYGVPLGPAERALLATPSRASVWIRRMVKPVYNTVTRRWLGWSDREGQGRGAQARCRDRDLGIAARFPAGPTSAGRPPRHATLGSGDQRCDAP